MKISRYLSQEIVGGFQLLVHAADDRRLLALQADEAEPDAAMKTKSRAGI